MRRSGVGCIEAEASGNSLDATRDLNRSSLLLSNGTLYFAEGALEPPGGKELTTYHGWVLAYDPTNLQQIWSWTTTVGGQQSGIWMAGCGLAADDGGYTARRAMVYVERQQRWLQLRRFHPEILRPQYDSAQHATRDSYGKGVRFTLPTVAHGRVYVEGKAQLAIFGLLRQ